MTLIRKNRSPWGKPSHSVTLFITNPTSNGIGSNPTFCSDRAATDRLRQTAGQPLAVSRTVSFAILSTQSNYLLGCAMAQAVSRRPLTMEARGSVSGQVHVRFVVDKVALG
jgi:hypothetical protein